MLRDVVGRFAPVGLLLRTAARSVALVLFVLGAGCGSSGDQLAPVTGKVLVAGQPAARALVVFHADGPPDLNAVPATAATGADGSFTLSTGSKGGAKPGKYIVTVVWPDPARKPSDVERMRGVNPYDAPDLLGGRYGSREMSRLRAEIKPGPNALEPFDLK